MEKGDTDLASVIRNRTNLNTINPILIRFYWQEMLEAVGEIHRKSRFKQFDNVLNLKFKSVVSFRRHSHRLEACQLSCCQRWLKTDRFWHRYIYPGIDN